MINNLKDDFKKVFGTNSNCVYFSPGRVNLIGEHIDYNGGFVFPCALDIGTYGVYKKRNDNICRFYSNNYKDKDIIEIDLNTLKYDQDHNWVNYMKGIIYYLNELGYKFDGFDLLIEGTIPNGSGLSSSASIELLMATILNTEYNLNIDKVELIKLCQKSENEYIGLNCGIMDQFAIGICEKNKAVMLNTNTLEYTHVPLDIEGYKIVICNTKVKRGLADSKYNERRKECDLVLEKLNTIGKFNFLCEATLKDLENIKPLLNGDVLFKRAKHAISENDRTQKAKNELTKGNIIEFGNLLNQSHESLKTDYEVSCKELDLMVELAQKYGAIGARMTGAGFGGCTVNIVPDNKVKDLLDNLPKDYKKETGLNGEVYIANSGNGARKL
ncbi:MAG: galactokinase [Lachnospirales bacterium]